MVYYILMWSIGASWLQVWCINAFSDQGAVSIVLASCSPAVPSAPPQSVSAVTNSSFSIQVAWHEPPVEQQNGPISSYAIVYGVHPTLEPAQSSLIRTVASSYLLTQLSAYKEYYIKVAASTVNGTGPYSRIYNAKTFAHGEPSKCRI